MCFAEGSYAGDTLAQALKPLGKRTAEIIRRSDAVKGFVLLPRRWVTWVLIASVKLIMRRLARA